jgi:hypothetical protein
MHATWFGVGRGGRSHPPVSRTVSQAAAAGLARFGRLLSGEHAQTAADRARVLQAACAAARAEHAALLAAAEPAEAAARALHRMHSARTAAARAADRAALGNSGPTHG